MNSSFDFKEQIVFATELHKQNILKDSMEKIYISEYQQEWIIDWIGNNKTAEEISKKDGRSSKHIMNLINRALGKLYNYRKYILNKGPFEELLLRDIPFPSGPWNALFGYPYDKFEETQTVGYLMTFSVQDLLKLRRFGWSSINHIQKIFQKNGVMMKGYEIQLLKQNIFPIPPYRKYIHQTWKKGNEVIKVLIMDDIKKGGVIIFNPEKDIPMDKRPKSKMVKDKDGILKIEKLTKEEEEKYQIFEKFKEQSEESRKKFSKQLLHILLDEKRSRKRK